jgi:hypothetical protein
MITKPVRNANGNDSLTRSLLEAMDPSLVGAHEQSSVAYGQAVTPALDLPRPQFFSIGRIVSLDDSISTYVKGVPPHREPDRMFAMDLPLEELGQLGSDPLDSLSKFSMLCS